MISTRSPGPDSSFSSCTWQTVRRWRILPYFGCRTIRGTSTRRVLLDAALVTVPVSTRLGMVSFLVRTRCVVLRLSLSPACRRLAGGTSVPR